MANIFISYSDVRYCESLARIKRQAKASGLFDKVIAYTPKNLPSYITSSPLFAFHRGGGYWVWKPYIIYKTLQNCNVGDVVYYADAGCSINAKSREWETFAQLIKKQSAIFFQYRRGFNYGWGRFCKYPQNNSVSIKYWMKPAVEAFFRNWFGDDTFTDYGKILAGACVIRKEEIINRVIDDWLKIALFHPSLFIDPWGAEFNDLPDTFNAHRHDQSILTALVYYYKDKYNIAVVPETSETDKNAAIVATRWRQAKMSFWSNLKHRLYILIHGYL